jgi:hypothetical protein
MATRCRSKGSSTVVETTEKSGDLPPVIEVPAGALVTVCDIPNVTFIDNSRSTGYSEYSGKNVLKIENKIARQITSVLRTGPVVYWNSKPNPDVRPEIDDSIRSQGMTDPSTAWTGSCRDTVIGIPILVFITDGGISASDVAKTARYSKTDPKKLTICVIVCRKSYSPATLNISVLQGICCAENEIYLFVDTETEECFVLMSHGPNVPNVDVSESWETTMMFAPEFLMGVNLCVGPPPPPGYVPIGGLYINTTKLFRTYTMEFHELTHLPWPEIVRSCYANGTMRKLEAWLKNQCDRLASSAKTEVVRESVPAFTGIGMRRMRLLGKNRAELNAEQMDEFMALRAEFTKYSGACYAEMSRVKDECKTSTHDIAKWKNEVFGIMHSIESAGFTVAALAVRGSNRAKRAKTAKPMEIAEIMSIAESHAIRGMCEICFEEGAPLCVTINKHDGDTFDGDNGINFPLSLGSAACKDSYSTICHNCAMHFQRTSDPLHRPVETILPLVPFSGPMMDVVLRVLCPEWAHGATLPCMREVYFAMIDQMRARDAAAGPIPDDEMPTYAGMKHIIESLMGGLMTSPTLTEDGSSEKVPLGRAFGLLMNPIDGTDHLISQPFSAVMLILRHVVEFRLVDFASGYDLPIVLRARRRFIRQLVGFWLHRVLNKTTEPIIKKFISEVFVMRLGVAVVGPMQHIDWRESGTMRELLGSRFMTTFGEIRRMCEMLGTDIGEFFPPNAFTALMVRLVCMTTHVKVAVGEEVLCEDSMMVRVINPTYKNAAEFALPDDAEVMEMLYQFHFGKYFETEEAHTVTPPFHPAHLGPSVLGCCCGYSFLTGIEYPIKLVDLVEHARRTRAIHFKTVYGAENPTLRSGPKVSSHTSLHRTISEMNPDVLTKEVVMSIHQKLVDNGRGNIHTPRLIKEIVESVASFIGAKGENVPGAHGILALDKVPLAMRIEAELRYYNTPIVDGIVSSCDIPPMLELSSIEIVAPELMADVELFPLDHVPVIDAGVPEPPLPPPVVGPPVGGEE